MKVIRFLQMALICNALGIAACGESADNRSDEAAADTGGTAVVALASDLDHANILASNSRYTQEILRYVLFLPLVQYDEKLGYEPALAESFEVGTP